MLFLLLKIIIYIACFFAVMLGILILNYTWKGILCYCFPGIFLAIRLFNKGGLLNRLLNNPAYEQVMQGLFLLICVLPTVLFVWLFCLLFF